jgi:hypothetical protein
MYPLALFLSVALIVSGFAGPLTAPAFAEPPVAGPSQPGMENSMKSMPSPDAEQSSPILKTPAAPDTKDLYVPKCTIDDSLPLKDKTKAVPGQESGYFSCRA